MSQSCDCGMAPLSLLWCPVFLLEVYLVIHLILSRNNRVYPSFRSWDNISIFAPGWPRVLYVDGRDWPWTHGDRLASAGIKFVLHQVLALYTSPTLETLVSSVLNLCLLLLLLLLCSQRWLKTFDPPAWTSWWGMQKHRSPSNLCNGENESKALYILQVIYQLSFICNLFCF